MNEERMMVLKMLEDGKITAEEAAKLLSTMEESAESKKEKPPRASGKFMRVRITDSDTNKVRANIRIPVNVLKMGSKFGARFSSKINGIETDDLMRRVEDGEVGKILDIFDEEDGEHVEVFIE